jgi:hypothetical protein
VLLVLVIVLAASANARAQTSAPPPAGYPPGVYAPPGWVPAPPPEPVHPRRVFSLTISPIRLVFPVVELTGEARAHDKVGVALIGGGGGSDPNISETSATAYEAGAQVRVYVLGDFRHGMQVGGELLYLHLSGNRLSRNGEGLAVGPFLGYKIMIDAGFTFDAQLGIEHISARAASGNNTANDKAFIPLLNLNVGWSF